MAPNGPATLPPPPPIVQPCSWESGAGARPRPRPRQERLGGRLGRGRAQRRSAPTTKPPHPPPPNTELPNLKIRRRSPSAWIHRDRPRNQKAAVTRGYRWSVEGRYGWVGGTLHRMDAVAEPTRTYLRRVPPTQPYRPNSEPPGPRLWQLLLQLQLQLHLKWLRLPPRPRAA